jgi:AbrB family looped-hinge helix DNA binding protein
MQMKVFNKGQVVIPAAIRKRMELQVGDMLDVYLDKECTCIELKKAESHTRKIAGSLAIYSKGKDFPSRKQMHKAFAKGMSYET